MSDEDPHKRMRRFGELCGYFYGRRFFGLETIMSDRDSDNMLLELQEARAEIDRLRELLRWRDVNVEPLPDDGDFLVFIRNKDFPQGVLGAFHLRHPHTTTGEGVTHWMPMLKLPGGE